MAQWYRALLARNAQARQRSQVGANCVGQFDPDRHLALRQVKFGQAGVVIAGGGHPHCLADGSGRHAEVGGARRVWPNNNLWPHQRGAGLHIAHPPDAAQFSFNPLSGGEQRHRVFALQHQLHFDAGVGRANGKAGTGNVAQLAAQLGFDAGHGDAALVAVAGAQGQHGAPGFWGCAGSKGVAAGAPAYRAEHAFDLGQCKRRQPGLLGDRPGFGQGAAWGELELDLGLAAVCGWHKAGWQQRHQGDGADEKQA